MKDDISIALLLVAIVWTILLCWIGVQKQLGALENHAAAIEQMLKANTK